MSSKVRSEISRQGRWASYTLVLGGFYYLKTEKTLKQGEKARGKTEEKSEEKTAFLALSRPISKDLLRKILDPW